MSRGLSPLGKDPVGLLGQRVQIDTVAVPETPSEVAGYLVDRAHDVPQDITLLPGLRRLVGGCGQVVDNGRL